MKRIIIAILLIVLLSTSAFGASKENTPITLAVLPFDGGDDFPQSELTAINELFVTSLIQTNEFTILERALIDSIIEVEPVSETITIYKVKK